jgi:hypothetical protein
MASIFFIAGVVSGADSINERPTVNRNLKMCEMGQFLALFSWPRGGLESIAGSAAEFCLNKNGLAVI